MKRNYFSLVLSIMVLSLMVSGPVLAQMSGHGSLGKGYSGMGSGKGHMGGSKMGASHRGPGHLFGPDWHSTMSKSQKKQADQMHLQLKKETATLKAALKLKKTELNMLVVQDKPDMTGINQKIKEVLEMKRQLMVKKYSHKVEMRSMLSSEQRVSFDMGILGKSGRRSHKR